jgi:MFS family permease
MILVCLKILDFTSQHGSLFLAHNPSVLAVRENVARAFRHRDFRLLWYGAFLSFVGSWIQNNGEKWLVNAMWHDDFKLSVIAFCGSAPVAVLGPFAGTFADAFDKKVVLNIAQILFAMGALSLSSICIFGHVEYWQLVAVALLFGLVGAFEGPTRQSVVGRVVPPEDLAQAVPLNAMTFNVARLIGPAIAGVLLAIFDRYAGVQFGSGICYALNGISYLALIYAVVSIKANLKPYVKQALPVGDLIMEGMLYTFRDLRFRTLFFMELIASACGMFYIAIMPSFTTNVLHMKEGGYAIAYILVGIGAITGLLFMTTLADKPYKSLMIRIGMATMGLCVLLLGFANAAWQAFPLFLFIGASVLVQFNTTNTLFQLLSPDRLRGRVLAMHQWAIGGLGPLGTLFFGWLAQASKVRTVFVVFGHHMQFIPGGLHLALKLGGVCILVGALWGSLRIKSLSSHSWELVNQSS